MKNPFYFNKTDRELLCVALGLLLLIGAVRIGFPALTLEKTEGEQALTDYRKQVAASDSLKRAGRYYTRRTYPARTYPRKTQAHRVDSMPIWRAAKDSARRVREQQRRVRDSLFALQYPRAEKYPAGTQLDLNTADTTELKKVPGIGSGIARAIVNYRERLGGFYEVKQLAELKMVTPELLTWFIVSHPQVQKLRLNHDKLDRLRAHPYLNYYQARKIIDERNARGDIKSLSRLSNYKEFTEKDFERLQPYLDFD
jgi:competence ComEA-like helix-hairpin-helix protein